MNFDTNTTKYSAFAIVAIESVWPNVDGNEVPPDVADFNLLGIESDQISRKGLARESFQSAQFSDSEGDYQRSKGYYKILPLNVLRVDTNTSLNGSQFSVSFTLDDLLLVADENADFLNATGLPFKTQDLIDLGNDKTLPNLLNDADATWNYIRDEELGLNRYRVTGDSSQFNVEDLVEPNDTVTIWLYHDPSDFYIKDEIPTLNEERLDVSDEITTVVGSADRRSQYSSATQDFSDYILNSLGLIDKFSGASIEGSLANASNSEEEISESILLSREEVLNAVINFGSEAIESRIFSDDDDDSDEALEDFVRGFGIPSDSAAYVHVLRPYILPIAEETPTETLAGQNPIREQNLIISTGRALWDEENKLFTPDRFGANEVQNLESLTSNVSAYSELSTSNDRNLQNLAIGLQQFKGILEQKLVEYNGKVREQKSYSVVDQRFNTGRRMLVNDFSGETPYLALKGKISDIKVNVGHQTGAYTVTISGQGYEKTLKEHEVFYEDLFFPEASIVTSAEYITLYMNVSPARVLVDVINRYASKNLVFKDIDNQVTLSDGSAINHYIEDPNFFDLAEQKDLFGSNQILSRGNYIYKEYKSELEREDVRVFYPLNFLDVSRVYEMIRALDLSFEQEEALYRNARMLKGRVSVFQNLKALGGTQQFYEMFVDETGRFRYRFTFEAYERTPNLAVTPLIDDSKLLSGATFGVTDSALSTVVDVYPSGRTTNDGTQALLSQGRALPEVGEVPIEDISVGQDGKNVNVKDLLAPDFFRYGLQTLSIEDVYTAPANAPKRRAVLYHNVFGKPLKNARINVINDTSYRLGNTVLVSLQKNKYRSKKVIDINKFLEWLEYLRSPPVSGVDGQTLTDMYIGIDERLINKDSYTITQGEYEPIPGGFYSEYQDVESAKSFVLEQFIATFKFLRDEIGLRVITPEFFPNTFWYYNLDADGGEDFVGDEGKIPSSTIRAFYRKVLNSFANNSTREFLDNTSSSEVRLENASQNVQELADTQFTATGVPSDNDDVNSAAALDVERSLLYEELNDEQRLIALFNQASSEEYGDKALNNSLREVKSRLQSGNFVGALTLSQSTYNLLRYNDASIKESEIPNLESEEASLRLAADERNEKLEIYREAERELSNNNTSLTDARERLSENKAEKQDLEDNVLPGLREALLLKQNELSAAEQVVASGQDVTQTARLNRTNLRAEVNELKSEIQKTETNIQTLQNGIESNTNLISILETNQEELEQQKNAADEELITSQNNLDTAAATYRTNFGDDFTTAPIYLEENLEPLEDFINQIQDLISQKASIQNAEVATTDSAIQEDIVENPGLVKTLKFQNFRAASYYIESVAHKFEYGSSAVTSLQLNYGQDNLMLLEPKNNIPIGFISIERFLKIGFDSDNDNFMFNEDGTLSGEQKLYIEQFKQDKNYLRGSLLYQAQKLRTSSNYMRQLSLIDNLDTTIVPPENLQDVTSSDDIYNSFDETLRESIDSNEFLDATSGDLPLSSDFFREALPVVNEVQDDLGVTFLDEDIDDLENLYNQNLASQGGQESSNQDIKSFVKLLLEQRAEEILNSQNTDGN